ncbi:MAG: aldo/keto reductase [Candidatus Krumholzibacteriia bacterium]
MATTRRTFLRLAGAGVAAVLVGPGAGAGEDSSMRKRPIPGTGEEIPVIGMGTWQTFDVGRREAERRPLRAVLEAFFSAGGRVIDSSPMYGRAEEVVGDLLAESGFADRAFLATKVWTEGRQAGIRQMEQSLARLRTERLDLMQVHNLVDWRTHLRTLQGWKEEGRVRYIGVTHYRHDAFDALEQIVREERVDFVQLPYSLADRKAEERLLPAAADSGVAVLVMRPFREGDLFRRVRGRPLPGWADEIDCETWSELFLKFILGHPAVTCPIPATGNPDHMRENMAAGHGRLPDAALREKMVAALDV